MEPALLILEILVVIGAAALLVFLFAARRVIVFEYERGLLYHNGKFQRILEPGRHWTNRYVHRIQKVDVRTRSVSIPGQEVLSADNITLRISLAATFKVENPYQVVIGSVNYLEELYLLLQTQLRDLVGAAPIDQLLAQRRQMGEQLFESAKESAAALGVALISVSIKDTMFPGELKNIFAQVVNARNEGLAALERARGESAALRNLANAAKLIEDNPALYRLRLLQAIGGSSGNTIVLAPSADGLDLAALRHKDKKS
jgi:regulator of protease activity HflC (stomatin/prohibitin superfamily)